MKYLVTGGAGFIGSNFIRHLLETSDSEVLNFDKLTYAGNLMNLADIEDKASYSFVKGDVCDKLALKKSFESFKPGYVVNFAAESHVDRSIMEPEDFIRTNVLGTQNLLKFSLEYGVERFVQISTDEVYGSLGKDGLFTEDTSLNPHSPYSASKAAADLLVQAYHDTYGLPVNITRCSNNYGPYQFPEKLIPLVIVNCMIGKKIPIYGDGLNVRDWIHVEDHCRALMNVIDSGAVGETYNIGVINEQRNIDVVKLLIDVLSHKLPNKEISEDLIEFVEDRPGHDRRYAIDASKMKKLGWKPKTKFGEGLEQTVDWYFENQDWLKSVINREYMEYYQKNYGQR